MLGQISKGRHAIVGVAIVGTSALAGFGVIGAGDQAERFDGKTIVVRPVNGDALRITEYVDQDFGRHKRHGYERLIPNDFGEPEAVTADSPDAPSEVNTFFEGSLTRIRIGDADIEIDGQHRYVLSYTYPHPHFDQIGLVLDIVAPLGGGFPGDAETGRFELVVTGIELANTTCNVGGIDSEGGCELARDTSIDVPVYRVVIEPLRKNQGLSISGNIVAFTDSFDVPVPPIPERRPDRTTDLALALLPIGAAGAIPVYRWARRKGRNEVFAGGAAVAAYGSLPPPRFDGTVAPARPTSLVADSDLGDLATIEFVPPKGIEPWEGAVLISERLGDDAIEAWFSGLTGREAINLEADGSNLSIASGPRRNDLAPQDAALLGEFLGIKDPYVTGKYDAKFAGAWTAVGRHQRHRIAETGWWKHMPPGGGFNPKFSGSSFGIIVLMFFAVIWIGSGIAAFVGLLRTWPLAIGFAIVLPAVVAYFVYRTLLPARSAQGSALALRTESFRRFLEASEGHHVEWAWTHGLLREYSAWAVALGEADAWSKALDRANVPAPARLMAGPILIDRMGPSVRSSRTAPSSSGSGGSGGGGFSGGSVGGGGGGGSSGSW